MIRKLFFALVVFAFFSLGAQTPFLVYDFEDSTTNPSIGIGTLSLIGGVSLYSGGFFQGWTDTGIGGIALNTGSYPEASSNPETAGIMVQAATTGFLNIHLSWNNRNSNTAANRFRLQYTLDGFTWVNFDANETNAINQRVSSNVGHVDFDNGMYVTAEGSTWYYRSADLSSITEANNNSNFAVRFVTAFPTEHSQYQGSTGNYGTSGTIRIDNIIFTHAETSTVLPPVANPLGGTFHSPIQVSLSCATEDATIFFEIFPYDAVYTYVEPIPVNHDTTLRFWATKEDLTQSASVTESYIILGDLIRVNSLLELRQYAPDTGQLFQIENEVFITYVQSFRNQKFIQDDTAGMLIDDEHGVIQTVYQIGDGMTEIIGTLHIFGGLLQFLPTADPGMPSSAGNTIIPLVITMNDFLNDFETYESRLVAFQNVYFTTTGNFAIAQTYPITDGKDTIHFRSTFHTDYLDTPIPSNNLDLIGLLTGRNEDRYITARFFEDFRSPTYIFELPVQYEHRLIGNYPNPFNPNTTIAFELKSETFVNISIFNIRGQRIKTLINEKKNAGSHTIYWNGKDDYGFNVTSGIYFYRMQTPGKDQVKRAILMK